MEASIAKDVARSMNKEEKRIIARSRTLINWDSDDIRNKIDAEHDEKCMWCNANDASLYHIVWSCPHFEEVRKTAAPTAVMALARKRKSDDPRAMPSRM